MKPKHISLYQFLKYFPDEEFENPKIGFRKWLSALYILQTVRKRISALQVFNNRLIDAIRIGVMP